MNQQLKALKSVWAKKFIPSHLFVTSKAHSNLQGVFPTKIGFVILGRHVARGGSGGSIEPPFKFRVINFYFSSEV